MCKWQFSCVFFECQCCTVCGNDIAFIRRREEEFSACDYFVLIRDSGGLDRYDINIALNQSIKLCMRLRVCPRKAYRDSVAAAKIWNAMPDNVVLPTSISPKGATSFPD